jgi:hypothetical protein
MNGKTLYQLGPPEHQNDAFSRRHPPMAVKDRAKIFAPFAALPPYAKALNRCQKKAGLVRPAEILEDMAAQIDTNLKKLLFLLEKSQNVPVALSYFIPVSGTSGVVKSCRASVLQADAADRTLTFVPQNQTAVCTIAFSQLCRLDLD